jgi:hypothetical protein
MKMRLGLLFASCLLMAAAFRFDDAGDWKELKGDWQPTKMELDGNPLPAEEVKEFVVTMSEGKYSAKRGDQVIDEGTSKIDASSLPSISISLLPLAITRISRARESMRSRTAY